MTSSRNHFMEHLAVASPLSLREFCLLIQKTFEFPNFRFDCENETEWGSVEVEGIEYNVSRPYEPGILHSWDVTTPKACNFGVTLTVFTDVPVTDNVVPRFGQQLANCLDCRVFYHRTWLGVDNNVKRDTVFMPLRAANEA